MCSILHFHMLLLLFSEGTECVCYVATIITDTPRQYYEYSGKSLKVQQFYQYKDLLIKGRTWDVCLCVSQKYKTFLFQKVHSNVLCKWMLRDCGPNCQTCFGIGIFLKVMRSAYWRKVVQRNLIWNFYGEKTALLGKNQDFLGNRRKVARGKLWKKVVLSSLTWHGHFPGSHW